MEVFLQENIPPHHGATPARSVNRHDLQRALEEADGSMKPWENHGETMGFPHPDDTLWLCWITRGYLKWCQKKRPSLLTESPVCLPGFCHSSVIQIHRDSLHLSIIFSAPWCRIFPTTYSTLYWIKIWDMMLYVFRQITSLQKDMYIYICHPLKQYV